MDDCLPRPRPVTEDPPLILSIAEVADDGGFPVGTVGEIDDALVVGRDPSADVRIDHPTVSRRHVRLRRVDELVEIENLSRHGTTFVNRQPLAPGSSTTARPEALHVQVGAYLLRVELPEITMRFDRLIVPDDAPNDDVILEVEFVGRSGRVKWSGAEVHLSPLPMQVLGVLADSAGEIVSRFTIQEALDPDAVHFPNVDQNVHHVRTALRAQLEEHPDAAGRLRIALAAFAPDQAAKLGTVDEHQLARRTIRTHRGRGYQLALRTHDVRVIRR